MRIDKSCFSSIRIPQSEIRNRKVPGEFGDGGEVVVVVLGDEPGHVYDAHLLAEARVCGGSPDLFLAQGFEAADEAYARGAERGEQVFKHRVVVAGLVGLAVAHVCGAQGFEPLRVVFEAAFVQFVEVNKMADVLLY